MSKPIPQEAIESLPENYTILGWGDEEVLPSPFEGYTWSSLCVGWQYSDDWGGGSGMHLYAAPTDSEIVRLNQKGSNPQEEPKQSTTPMKTIYIAGPMRGKQFFNFPAFDAAREKLFEEGWEVISPADIDREHGFDARFLPIDTDWNDLSEADVTIEDCFDRDIAAIRGSDAIYMLKGWQSSKGATAEHACAVWLGKEILYEEESICEEAYRIQGGDRQQDYGDPTKNFEDIASLWNAYFTIGDDKEAFYLIEPRDVAHMMILMKIARNCHKPKRDNWTDMAGYAQCGGKIDRV